MFELDPRLARDTAPVAELPLSSLRLMADADVPWLILVPRREGVTELHRLDRADRILLSDETARAASVLESLFHPDKINIGALGNQVAQLHVHVVARFRHDRAWPGPIWGQGTPRPYAEGERDELCRRIAGALEG